MKTILICHRGINRSEENTFQSIIETIKLKDENIIYGVEFDVQITKDDLIICYHDDTLKRLHGSEQRIYDLKSQEITDFNLPFLDDILQQLSKNVDLIIDIELKIYQPYSLERLKILCHKTIEICEKNNVLNQCVFTSFNEEIIREFLSKKITKKINIGLLSDIDYDIEKLEEFKKIGINFMIFNKKCIKEICYSYNDIIKDINLFTYTFYNINSDENEEIDKELINFCKVKNIGMITDDYKKIKILINKF